MTFKRNYHDCERCKHGFYPVDRLLGVPEEGELTSEMEKRVLFVSRLDNGCAQEPEPAGASA